MLPLSATHLGQLQEKQLLNLKWKAIKDHEASKCHEVICIVQGKLALKKMESDSGFDDEEKKGRERLCVTFLKL